MSTHNGYVKEFPFIRIDSFTTLSNPSTSYHPLYYFLTHSHTDHLAGLNSPSFRGIIYMTPITKMLVQNTMEAPERVRWEEFGGNSIKRPKRKFDNLFRETKGRRESNISLASSSKRGVDQIREINLNQPLKLQGTNVGDYVQVTAIDANHCPGSCMFLFEGIVDGSFRSCLVTGDLRAEPWYIDSLLHNPLLAPYTTLSMTGESRKGKEKEGRREVVGPTKELDCIYLDTSNVLLNEELVEKAEAIEQLIEMIRSYPSTTKFFLNCWTWGYEELLKTIYRTYGGSELIHLDWYKYKIYTSSQMKSHDPLLSSLGTLSTTSHPQPLESEPSPSLHLPSVPSTSSSTESKGKGKGVKFHACERYWKCDSVWENGRGCYTFPEEFLDQQEPQDETRARKRECREKKKLVRPGSGEYLRGDGTIGVRDQEEEDEEGDRMIVYVNPVEMMKWKWEEYRESTWEKIKRAKGDEHDPARGGMRGKGQKAARFPKSLLVPLARHSTLPELQRFVSIFRPKTLYPLTISTAADTRQHPAREYLSMPGLFEGKLAKGGEERLRREAKEYVKGLKRGRTGKVVTSSPDDEEARQEGDGDGERWFGNEEGGKWEEEMKKRGLNIEGGKEVVEEALKWSDRGDAREKEVEISKNGGVRDMEIEEVETEVITPELPQAPSTSTLLTYERQMIDTGNRRLRYGDPPSQITDSSQAPILVPSTSSVLLPSALPPPQPNRPTTPSTNPSRASDSTTSNTRTLRKSVTFAPSPTKSPELMLSARKGSIVPLKRSRSLPIPPSPVGLINPRPIASPVHRPSPDPPQPVSSSSTSSSRCHLGLTDSENVRPPSSSNRVAKPASKSRSKPKQSILASLEDDGSQRARLLLSIQRTLQGKIGPNGTIIPFSDREREELKRRERKFREERKGESGKGKETAREAAEVERESTVNEEQQEMEIEETEVDDSLQEFETVLSSY